MAIFGQISGFDPIQALEAGRAHGPGLTSPSRPSKHESPAHGLTVGLTGSPSGSRAHRRADGHELDGPTFEGRGPSRGRAHGPGLTVQGSRRSWTGPKHEGRGQSRASRARPGPRTVQGSREHGSRRADGHELDRLTVGAHRPGPGSPSGSPSRPRLTVGLTVQGRGSREHGPRAGPDIGLMATGWTGPTFEGTAHGLTGSRAGPARPSRAAASPGPGSTGLTCHNVQPTKKGEERKVSPRCSKGI